MRKLILFIAIAAGVLGLMAAVNWWVDPFAEIWKPAALADARASGCLISQELIGIRYFDFKLAVFHSRPTRTFVVGSSRVLKLASRPGERSFANLGYPGTAPETILKLLRALPATPTETMYIGVEAFWLNSAYVVPDTDPSAYTLAKYLTSRSAFSLSVSLLRDETYVRPPTRWRRVEVGSACTMGRAYPSINWRLDGSRVWSWELDPRHYPKTSAPPYTRDLGAWRNGYYDHWRSLDESRVNELAQALELARKRGWRVIGFAPPEPPRVLSVLDSDPRLAPEWRAYLRLMPRLFKRYGFAWVGLGVSCPAADFPDAFHSDAACSARLRDRLDEVARRLN
jgi:hypothetical protein